MIIYAWIVFMITEISHSGNNLKKQQQQGIQHTKSLPFVFPTHFGHNTKLKLQQPPANIYISGEMFSYDKTCKMNRCFM